MNRHIWRFCFRSAHTGLSGRAKFKRLAAGTLAKSVPPLPGGAGRAIAHIKATKPVLAWFFP
jgi:hypothetical protein